LSSMNVVSLLLLTGQNVFFSGTFYELCSADLPADQTLQLAVQLKNSLLDPYSVSLLSLTLFRTDRRVFGRT